MTISSGVNDGITYSGNDLATNFAFPFKVNTENQVEVIIRDPDGVETIKTINTDYTVNDQDDEGSGSVDYPVSGSPLATGYKITINPKMDYLQETDIKNQGRFAPETHEQVFDTLMMHIKELKGIVNRAVLFKKSSQIIDSEFPDPEDGQLLAWDGVDGTIKNVSGIPSAIVTSYWQTILTNTTLSDSLDDLGFSSLGKTLTTLANAAAGRSALGVVIGTDVQAYDADLTTLAALSSITNLTALANLASNGIVTRTGSGTISARTITGTSNQISVSNGDGVSGNPTLSTPQDIGTSSSVAFLKGVFSQTAAATDSITAYNSNASVTALGIVTIRSLRAANSGFSFLDTQSNDGSDVEFRLRGDGNAFADGSWSGSGADYQEFFHSLDGQAIIVGKTVVLDGDKVREATENDDVNLIMGVVRPKEPNKNSAVVGNCAWNFWTDKYLTDDYGRYFMEDYTVTNWIEKVDVFEESIVEEVNDETGETSYVKLIKKVGTQDKIHSYNSDKIPKDLIVPNDAKILTFKRRKLNPAWSAEHVYTPREDRPEWNLIGLLGQIQIEKGQPVNPRWLKMKDVSDSVELYYVR